jgi:hypothetical protein
MEVEVETAVVCSPCVLSTQGRALLTLHVGTRHKHGTTGGGGIPATREDAGGQRRRCRPYHTLRRKGGGGFVDFCKFVPLFVACTG